MPTSIVTAGIALARNVFAVHGFSEASYHPCRSQFSSMNVPKARRPQEPKSENAQPKNQPARQPQENKIIREVQQKTVSAPPPVSQCANSQTRNTPMPKKLPADFPQTPAEWEKVIAAAPRRGSPAHTPGSSAMAQRHRHPFPARIARKTGCPPSPTRTHPHQRRRDLIDKAKVTLQIACLPHKITLQFDHDQLRRSQAHSKPCKAWN